MKKFLWLKKLKILCRGKMLLVILIAKNYTEELQKTNQREFRIEKLKKRKGDKLYLKWNGYDRSFNS